MSGRGASVGNSILMESSDAVLWRVADVVDAGCGDLYRPGRMLEIYPFRGKNTTYLQTQRTHHRPWEDGLPGRKTCPARNLLLATYMTQLNPVVSFASAFSNRTISKSRLLRVP